MSAVSVYDYDNPRQFLLDALSQKQAADPHLSVRSLAKKMGIKSHTLLVLLLQGKRPLRVKHAGFLAKGYGLSSQERLYLQALIQFASAGDPDEKQLCSLWLSELHPAHHFQTKQVSEYALVSQWLHMAILAATCLREFECTPEHLLERFAGRATIHEIRAALNRLLEFGLLKKNPEGVLEATYNRVTTADDIANLGARKYHKDVSQLAQTAIDADPVETREFQGFSLAVCESKIPLAKEMIRKFRSQFAKAVGADSGDHVYQMNIQFFRLTESPASEAEDEGVCTESNHKAAKAKGEYNV